MSYLSQCWKNLDYSITGNNNGSNSEKECIEGIDVIYCGGRINTTSQLTIGRVHKPAPGGRVPCWDPCLSGLHPLGHCDPVQHGTWAPNCYTERLTTVHPRSWRKLLLQEDGHCETHECTFQRGWRSVFVACLRQKEMGNFWAWFLACNLFGSKWNSGSRAREGLRAEVLSACPKIETLLIKTCFFQHKSWVIWIKGDKWPNLKLLGYISYRRSEENQKGNGSGRHSKREWLSLQ